MYTVKDKNINIFLLHNFVCMIHMKLVSKLSYLWDVAKKCLVLISTSYIYRIIVYYHKMLKDSNEKKIKLLKEQISLVSIINKYSLQLTINTI